jgi:hypothetical protein
MENQIKFRITGTSPNAFNYMGKEITCPACPCYFSAEDLEKACQEKLGEKFILKDTESWPTLKLLGEDKSIWLTEL